MPNEIDKELITRIMAEVLESEWTTSTMTAPAEVEVRTTEEMLDDIRLAIALIERERSRKWTRLDRCFGCYGLPIITTIPSYLSGCSS